MVNYTIGVTTFSDRYDLLKNSIEKLRIMTNNDIIIAINGNYKTPFSQKYRVKILELCIIYNNIYPIIFPEQRGLSKLWNTICIHSKDNWILMLNDDLEYCNNSFIENFENNMQEKNPDLCRINGSFSHFAIHKTILDEIGYFDERLLGFGEEDGDIIYRYIEKYKKNVTEMSVDGVINIVSDIRDTNIKPGIGKYSKFNRDFMFNLEKPKYIPNILGIEGMFGKPYINNVENIKQYPYEIFFNENKDKL
jgi:hypothetical protein